MSESIEKLRKIATIKIPDTCFAMKQLEMAMSRAAEGVRKFSKIVNTPGLRKVLKDANN